MSNQLITILIPTHNRAHLLERTLDSLLEQTHENWEAIIVDDKSKDETSEIVQNYVTNDSRFSYFLRKSPYPSGPSGARNYALDIAKKRGSVFIQLFDDDDIMHPEKLRFQMAPFEKDKGLDLTLCKFSRFFPDDDLDFSATTPEAYYKNGNLAEDFLFTRIRINSASPLFRASLLEEERFDEELEYGEERELFLRIFFRYRPKYVLLDKILFYYRYHFNSLTIKKGNEHYRIGSNILLPHKLWDYLYANHLLNEVVIAYLLRQFLLQNHNKDFTYKIYQFTFEENSMSYLNNLKFRFLIKFHSLYIRVCYKFLLLKI